MVFYVFPYKTYPFIAWTFPFVQYATPLEDVLLEAGPNVGVRPAAWRNHRVVNGDAMIAVWEYFLQIEVDIAHQYCMI